MRHVRLGRTGLRVSRLCLGTMTFGLQCDEPTSGAILDRAAAGGITFLDTSDVYPLGGGLETVGRTEEIVGRWLAGRRQDFVIATKCFGAMSARPWDRGTSRKHILDAIEGSLRRLRTDYVDLYQIHHPDPQTPMDETLRALDDVVRAGKARYVGCSNYHAYQVARAGVRHGGGAPPAGGGGRHVHGPDGGGLGAGASGRHVGHRRREPDRSARRRAGRGGQGTRRRSQGGAPRADTRIPLRRRSPMTVTRDPLATIRSEED